MGDRINKLLLAVQNELEKAEKAYKHAKQSAQEIAATALTSHSQAGDRFHSQGAADLAKQKLDTVLALKTEIEEKGEGVCFKHDGEDVYIVDNPILLDGFKLISTKSPLGMKIINNANDN